MYEMPRFKSEKADPCVSLNIPQERLRCAVIKTQKACITKSDFFKNQWALVLFSWISVDLTQNVELLDLYNSKFSKIRQTTS